MDETTRVTLDYARAILAGRSRHRFSEGRLKGPSARCIEIPWMADRIMAHGCRHILDIGFSLAGLDCMGTLLELVKRYHRQLEAVDIIDPERVRSRYPEKWIPDILAVPIHRGDIREIQLPVETYDAVTCISTIEHVGFDRPSWDDPRSAFDRPREKSAVKTDRPFDTDRVVLDNIHSGLKPRGTLLISVPMGRGGAVVVEDSLGYFCAMWEFDRQSWQRVAAHPGFDLVEESFFSLTDADRWVPVKSPGDLGHQTTDDKFAGGCALALMKKK